MYVVYFILIFFLLTFLAPFTGKIPPRFTGLITGLTSLAFFIYLQSFIGLPEQDGIIRLSFPWIPSFGIHFSFYIDGLSRLFLLIISGIGVLIFMFSVDYMKKYKNTHLFYTYLILFTTAMFGMVTSGNLILLFMFWELTSISSYLLIGFNHDKAEARNGALQALLISVTGGLALLAGFILLGQVTGTYELSRLLAMGEIVKESRFYPLIVTLIFIGAATKSAQFPFHFWLPGAMQAPAPVSAFLHSATMVKAGVFLLARVFPILGPTTLWHILPGIAGGITMLAGAYLAVNHTDLKKILAYTTVSALGTLFLLMGIGTEASVRAAVIFLFVHSL